jgi:predicted Zn-dependent protease
MLRGREGKGPRLARLWAACVSNILVACSVGLLAGCEAAPVTGRSQLILFPASQDAELGLQAYQQILAKSKVSKDARLNERVQTIGRRIAAVSGHPEFDWEFTLFENDQPNAFALPGGKVGVNTGLFNVAENDAQLAAVIGHEVAHAIARHGAERMSQGVLAETGLAVLGATTNKASTVQLAAAAATLGVILPYSRTQESEADHIGLLYMAEAGYDPREAVELWRNFERMGGGRPPEFLSTHPGQKTRIKRLQALMPEALAIYEKFYG